MNKTKIEWCDVTINPVMGCKNNCEYCYAKQLDCKTPKVIFMNSMSDVAHWQSEWVREVFEKIKKNKQHKYIFLTKSGHQRCYGLHFGERELWAECDNKCDNVFIGLSVTKQSEFPCGKKYEFLSVEPILEKIDIPDNYNISCIKQIIIGAETGKRKGKVIPKKEWIDSLCQQADAYGIKVFMKDSLIPIVGEENMRRELIWNNNNE